MRLRIAAILAGLYLCALGAELLDHDPLLYWTNTGLYYKANFFGAASMVQGIGIIVLSLINKLDLWIGMEFRPHGIIVLAICTMLAFTFI